MGGTTGRAHRACEHIAADVDDDTGAGEMLLVDLRVVFRDAGDPEALPTRQILDALYALGDRPWNEWRRGKPLSERGLARLLKGFKITSGTIRADGIATAGGTAKGYTRDSLTRAWHAYLSQAGGTLSVTSVTTVKTQELSASPSVTHKHDVRIRMAVSPLNSTM